MPAHARKPAGTFEDQRDHGASGQQGGSFRGFQLLDIHCSTCGAPAEYDIVKHTYACAYCGNETSVDQAVEEKKGFRKLRRRKLRESKQGFAAVACTCSGCAATVVFPEDEVLQSCSFCGRALVRGDYLKTPDFPELIIPFRLTPGEARQRFENWCARNAVKREARHLRACLDEMQGYYLPFELVRGPIDCSVSREGASRFFTCGGFLDGIFVNTSPQLDNLTLNAMEPYDLEELHEFAFGYLAKQKAKVDEIGGDELNARVKHEVAAEYSPVIEKTLETRNVSITPNTDGLLRMPVLLPVYYVRSGDVCAAVNGQTGKVAVRSEKTRKTMPWWIRPIVATLATFAVAFAIVAGVSGDPDTGAIFAGAFTLVMGLVFYTGFSNAYEGGGRRTLDPNVFTTDDVLERMPDGTLRAVDGEIARAPVKPVFYERVDGVRTQVNVRFTTASRMARMILVGLVVMFLPIVLAFVLNGFDYHGLHPEGAAVWLCIFVPVVPAYIVKRGRIDIYENPYVYTIDEKGRTHKVKTKSGTTTVLDVLKVLFTPPGIFAGLAIVLFLVVDVYLVLGG